MIFPKFSNPNKSRNNSSSSQYKNIALTKIKMTFIDNTFTIMFWYECDLCLWVFIAYISFCFNIDYGNPDPKMLPCVTRYQKTKEITQIDETTWK